MSAPETRVSSAPGSWRPRPTLEHRELSLETPAESRNTRLPPFNDQVIPDELLLSLSSTVCNRSSVGQTAHQRQCKDCGLRRPDPVWHRPCGRRKYRHFLEQPTSLSGAGRDISFLCDAMVSAKKTTHLPPLTDRNSSDLQDLSISECLIPEEYRVVKNEGLRSLELFEDAFTVQLQDDQHKLRVFPSLRPSGRQEAVQLMRMMDDMLEKAGVDQQGEELTQLSQMEGLLELVQAEQNIYNIVFHEAIRQVSVGCAERGQLLAKLRQRYQSLLERIPRRLKALHTEALAQRALDRRLTEEIHHIKDNFQQLSMELSRIRDHDVFVSQQTELAHEHLTDELQQAQTSSDVVQGYHELYELQRSRLEAQLLQTTAERDSWSQLTYSLALKVINMKKLELVRRLHLHEQSWFRTAENCVFHLTSKDTEDMNIIMELTDHWTEQLGAFMAQMKKMENIQCEEMNIIQKGIKKMIAICSAENRSHDPKEVKDTLEDVHSDLKKWSRMLTELSEHYEGEELFCRQQMLEELGQVQERWLNMSLQLLGRHRGPNGEAPESEQVQKDLVRVLSELLKQLDTQASGENGTYGRVMSLLGSMDSWVSKVNAVNYQTDTMSASDWLQLEKDLCSWQSSAEEVLQNISSKKTKEEGESETPNIHTETEEVVDRVKKFITNLYKFTDGDNHRLTEEVRSIHTAQTRWMFNLLLLMVPDHCEEQDHDPLNISNVSVKTLEAEAKLLSDKVESFSGIITSVYKLILEQQTLSHQTENDDEMDECRKLQNESTDWTETCVILLSGFKGDNVEVQPVTSSRSYISALPGDGGQTSEKGDLSVDPLTSTEDKDKTEAELRNSKSEEHEILHRGTCEEELSVGESAVLKFIDYDGNIAQRSLDESSIHLSETGELVVSAATEDTQKAFSDLNTITLLQQELHDSELRLQKTEQRALKAEEDLQAAMEKILELEKQLKGRPSLESKSDDETKKTPTPPPLSPSPPPPPPAAVHQHPPKKTNPEGRSTNSKRAKKR